MALKQHDVDRLRRATLRCIAEELGDAIEGEGLLKEAYEECGSVEEQRLVQDEARTVLAYVKARIP